MSRLSANASEFVPSADVGDGGSVHGGGEGGGAASPHQCSSHTPVSNPPTAAEFQVDQLVYFIAASQHIARVGRILHGDECKVTVPKSEGKNLEVCVTRLNKLLVCYENELATEPPPPLAGGFSLDAFAYYIKESQWLARGDYLQHGQKLLIVGMVHPRGNLVDQAEAKTDGTDKAWVPSLNIDTITARLLRSQQD